MRNSSSFLSAVSLLLLPTLGLSYDFGCNLYCYNGGQCRHGKGKFGSYQSVNNLEPDENPWEEQTHITGMYCQCPAGFTGVQCEISLIMCDIGGSHDNHTCFNGQECMKENDGYGNVFYHCSCDAATTIMKQDYVKNYCQHISTVFCNHKKNADVSTSSQYCTNGGKCLPSDPDGTIHNGCDCPKGWEGRHCETPSEGSWTMSNLIAHATPSNVFSFIFLAIVVIGGGLVLSWWKDKRRREMNRRELEEEEVYGDGFFAKDSARNFYSDNQSEMSNLSSSAKPREII